MFLCQYRLFSALHRLSCRCPEFSAFKCNNDISSVVTFFLRAGGLLICCAFLSLTLKKPGPVLCLDFIHFAASPYNACLFLRFLLYLWCRRLTICLCLVFNFTLQSSSSLSDLAAHMNWIYITVPENLFSNLAQQFEHGKTTVFRLHRVLESIVYQFHPVTLRLSHAQWTPSCRSIAAVKL